MKGSEIEVGREYLAYCGSLARVTVLETGVPYTYGTGGKTRAALVRAVADVPWAIDLLAARREGRKPVMVHRAGDEFLVPSKNMVREPLSETEGIWRPGWLSA